MTPLSSALRALREKATEGPIALFMVSASEGGTALIQPGRPGDKYGHQNFSMNAADLELLSLLANSSEQICAALAWADLGLVVQDHMKGHVILPCGRCDELAAKGSALADAYRSATRVGP